MNNTPLNLDSIRQPTPNVVGKDSASNNQNTTAKTKKFNFPIVGIADVPTISKTPLADTLVIKEQENPQMTYKITSNKNRGFKIQNLFSLTIVGCAIGALLSLLKRK